MTSCDLPRIRISDPAELIDALPYLLSFHPHESLVLIGFAGTAVSAGPQQVQVTVRLDLPARLPDGFDDEALAPLGEVLQRGGCRSVAAVLVTDSVAGDPRAAGGLLACRDLLAVAMAAADIEVLDVLVATDRRWWSLCCEQPDCCPGEGNQRLPGSSVAAAQAIFAGLVALPDREALVASLAGHGAEQRSALLPLLDEAERRRAAVPPDRLAEWRRAQIAGLLAAVERAPAGPEQLAGHAVALTDPAVRDALWLAIDSGCTEAALLMGEWHARLPAPYDAAPLFLYGWSLWRAGNATLAAMAADRALRSQPGYSAAELLATAAQRGLDPRTVPVLIRGRFG
ncbi:DUF4192 domain-containing protein [Jatrophihabitans sp.]|uniref:DUF4192 domain-containing protein n=1 Tax=Jatrophihabitans sp. TaxID=1932789 RepID=UPI002CA49FC5|nr:DUF4192 domain-containing protein [Jatrophihabitans sp.]